MQIQKLLIDNEKKLINQEEIKSIIIEVLENQKKY